MTDADVVSRRRGYIPPKRPYGFDDMLQDVLDFAVVMLVPNGRVSMWMPTANDENAELAIPTNAGLELLSICVQKFNKCMFGVCLFWVEAKISARVS